MLNFTNNKMNQKKSKIDHHNREYVMGFAFVFFIVIILSINPSSSDQSNVEKVVMKISNLALIVSLIALVYNLISGIFDERHNRTERYFYYTQFLFNHRQAFRLQNLEHILQLELQSQNTGIDAILRKKAFTETFRFQEHCIHHFRVIKNMTDSLNDSPLRNRENESIHLLIKSNYDLETLIPFITFAKGISKELSEKEDTKEEVKKKYKAHVQSLNLLIEQLKKYVQ
ncbi:hypothetical protein GVN16_16035 [Emticicia sp. CRIBPO]|uniref:hypothetical protein n=1 Tax=Emticicia sp. CRIBPO TaxID=2683258 RepID=UPI00141249C7|nr:hypothetical protein [Emticicia sp. CRIBPO]NBA87284.1 hypothetical protein [Emticicia sp. CRIBPO]